MIRWEDVEKYREQNSDRPQFISRYLYNRDNPYCGPVISNFYVDFDCAENLKLAKAETAHFVDIMIKSGVPEEMIKIRFTGGKGFSAEIPFQCFGAEPSEYLPLIWKTIAEQLKNTHRWKTLDLNVYDRRRLWRLTNTKHDKTGLFKVAIRYYDLKETPVETIRQFALKPVPYGPYSCDVDSKVDVVPSLRSLYTTTQEKVLQDLNEKEGKLDEFKIPSTFDPAKIWYCVSERINRGTKEPGRRPTAFYIAVAMRRLGATPEQVRPYILEFAKNCTPPLDPVEYEKDIEHAIESAFKHDYATHCGTPCFAELCDRKECWLFTKKETVKVFSPETLAKAKERLVSPDLEEWTQTVYDEIVCHEYKNRLVMHYLLLTGKMKNPKLKTIILVKGDPGGGKTTLANKISERYNTMKRGRFSEHALDFMLDKLKNYDVLYLMEMMNLSGEQGGVSTLKFLGADDQGYEVEVTEKDEKTGKFTSTTYKIPPLTVLCTTTNIEMEKQFERRAFVINVDDSPQQTQSILDFKAKKEVDNTLEALAIKQPSQNVTILDATISLIEDCDVAVLFPKTVTKLFESEELPLRVRGDYDKIMTLIKMRAAYFQFQRPCVKGKEKKVVFALPEDFIKVLNFADEPILQMLSGAEKRLRDAIPFILKLKDNLIEIGKDNFSQGFRIEDLKKIHKPKRSESTIRSILEELNEIGFLHKEKNGRTNIYSLVVDQSAIQKQIEGTFSDEQLRFSLLAEAEKEFETNFSTITQQGNLEIEIPDSLKNNPPFSGVMHYDVVDTKGGGSAPKEDLPESCNQKDAVSSQPVLEEWKNVFKTNKVTGGN
jgi:predicted transcriptional regulator